MKSLFVIPLAAALLLSAAPVLAQDGSPDPAHDNRPRMEKSLADMWDRKPREGRHDWKAEKEKIKSMTPDERQKYMDEKHAERKAKMLERIEKMPPEKQAEARAKMAEFEARQEAVRTELMALPPEEREARMKEIQKEFHEKHKAERDARFKERWDGASADDKAAFCAQSATHCTGGEDEPGLCVKAKELCAP